MVYQQSLEIERRLDRVLRLIRSGRYSSPMLAEELGVSIPTISRCVNALRGRGHSIRAENHGSGWRYVLIGKASRSKPMALAGNVQPETARHTSQKEAP
ncbi:MAG TPA: HTH domain-containing protein [Pirellulales bacterium]|nr:HTH domain-containing protein [Pirellulales bacterium]